MIVNKAYLYNEITSFCEKNDFEISEYGNNTIGENFIICKSNIKDVTISFIFDGQSSLGRVYKCIYSDLKQ